MSTVETDIFDFFVKQIYNYVRCEYIHRHNSDGKRTPFFSRHINYSEDFLREIERHLGIPQEFVHDFRCEIANSIACDALKWDNNPQLKAAILAYAENPINDYIPTPRKRTIDDTWEGT